MLFLSSNIFQVFFNRQYFSLFLFKKILCKKKFFNVLLQYSNSINLNVQKYFWNRCVLSLDLNTPREGACRTFEGSLFQRFGGGKRERPIAITFGWWLANPKQTFSRKYDVKNRACLLSVWTCIFNLEMKQTV